MGTFQLNVPLYRVATWKKFLIKLCIANYIYKTTKCQQHHQEKDLGWPSPWRSPPTSLKSSEWKRPPEHNASRCCGNTWRTITSKTQKTSNTSSPTKRWARSLDKKGFVHLEWPSFWVPTWQQSKFLLETENKYKNFYGTTPHQPPETANWKKTGKFRNSNWKYFVAMYYQTLVSTNLLSSFHNIISLQGITFGYVTK